MGNNRFFNEMFNIFLVLDLFSKKKLQYDRIKKYINLADLKKFLPGRTDKGFYLAVLMKASSTLAAVLAEVSMKMSPCSLAKASPSSLFTSLLASRSLRETT